MDRKIDFDVPNISNVEKEYILKALDSRFVSTIGPHLNEFEEKFTRYLKCKKSAATQSGTAALHISLYELGIGPGDEVIVPVTTFIASINPLLYVGAKPVFVDVDEETWNMLPDQIEQAITAKTKAIIPVHLYGNPCDMNAIMKIAKKHNLFVIEDATESLGAHIDGRFTGTFGDMGCFSFSGNKTITSGDGGMVVGNNHKQMEHIKYLINQAKDATGGYFHSEVGFKYGMSNLEAALGLAQFSRLQEFLDKKKEFSEIYKEELSDVAGVKFQKLYDKAVSSWWLTCITVDRANLQLTDIQEALMKKGIPTKRFFVPIVEFPPYKNHQKEGAFDNAYKIYHRGLCLPSTTVNSLDDARYIGRTIKELLT